MDREFVTGELKRVVEESLKGLGFELVELIYRYAGRDLFLRILADKPEGGISLGECIDLNRQLSQLLDERNLIEQNYALEVSSPGLDRVLSTENDFRRNLNKTARFFLKEAVSGKIEWLGKIIRVEGDSVFIEADCGIIEISLGKINKAKQVIEKQEGDEL